ncbi:hypothetical protein PC119_g24729 [Phytophthora cactorum]|nr:hypothetical protein PC119_g24729 [Phytophthora cactorum]
MLSCKITDIFFRGLTAAKYLVQQRLKIFTYALAVDEASILLPINYDGISLLQLLHKALRTANTTLQENGYSGGNFAVLADTNSKVHRVASSKDTIRVMDPSSRNDEVDEEKEMFLPYILTDAMETFCGRETTEARADPETGTSVDHKAAVVQDSAEAQWAALVSMRRPL